MKDKDYKDKGEEVPLEEVEDFYLPVGYLKRLDEQREKEKEKNSKKDPDKKEVDSK